MEIDPIRAQLRQSSYDRDRRKRLAGRLAERIAARIADGPQAVIVTEKRTERKSQPGTPVATGLPFGLMRGGCSGCFVKNASHRSDSSALYRLKEQGFPKTQAD